MSGNSKQKRGQVDRPKEDKMSSNLERKTGHIGQPKEDILSAFPDAKSGHFGREKADISGAKKRTFSTQKADISDDAHDKERARVNHHEPSIEPSEREEDPPALSGIDELADTLCSLYQIPDGVGWRLRDKFQSLAVELHGLGARPVEVRTFYSSRHKKPGVEFFAGDFVTWRASQQGSVAGDSPAPSRPPLAVAPDEWRRKSQNGGAR
jgi:hypothetical protein